MKALLLPITLLMLAATAAACLDLTPYPLVEVPEMAPSCDEEAGACADASDEGAADDDAGGGDAGGGDE